MKCYLHVGVEKTGTTTVQEFLHTNRELLARRGCLFTPAAGERNNWKLPVAAYDAEQRDDLTRAAKISTDDDLHRFRNRLSRDLTAAIERGRDEGCDQIILSSEHLQSRLRSDTSLKRLAGLLDAVGVSEVEVIIYLRDPMTLVSSLYSTMVKNGSTGWRPPGPEHPYFNRVCNHRHTLEQLASVFGSDSLSPRLFQSDTLIGGSIIDDVLEVTGIDGSGLARPTPLNESLSTTAVEILRRVNRYIPLVVDDAVNPARTGLLEIIERNNWGSKYQVDAETAAIYREAFAASNEWVRREFFPERQQLFSLRGGDKSSIATDDSAAVDPGDLDALAALVTDLWVERQRASGVDLNTTELDTRRLIERSGLFDADYYLQTNPGVAAAGVDPLTHFIHRGGVEGRRPSPSFDTRAYLAANPELRENNRNPLVHFLTTTGN